MNNQEYAALAHSANQQGLIIVEENGVFKLAPPPPPSLEDVVADYEKRIQARLDDFARPLYDDLRSAISYIGDEDHPVWDMEGRYCRKMRGLTWDRAFELLNSLAGSAGSSQDIPAWPVIEAQLPPLAWPEGSRGYVPQGGAQ